MNDRLLFSLMLCGFAVCAGAQPVDELTIQQAQQARRDQSRAENLSLISGLQMGEAAAAEHFKRGERHASRNEWRQAVEEYSQGLALQDRVPQVYLNRGIARRYLLDFDGAIADFTKTLELDANNFGAYTMRAEVYTARGELAKALADVDKACEQNPTIAVLYGGRAVVKAKMGDRAGAMADFDKLFQMKPDDAESYASRSLGKAELGDVDGAIADLTQAIERQKSGTAFGYHLGRAQLYMRKGDGVAALADLDQAEKLYPGRGDIANARGLTKEYLGDHAGALAELKRSVELSPDNAACFNNLAWVQYLQGDRVGAISNATHAIELNPRLGPAYGTRGFARYVQEDKQGALADCAKAMELIRQMRGDITLVVGMIHFIRGEHARAVEAWHVYLRKNPVKQTDIQPWLAQAEAKAGSAAK